MSTTNQNLDPNSKGQTVIIVSSVCCAVATVAVALRLFTRSYISRHVGIDDWLAITSLICTFGMAISQGINAVKCLGHHNWEFDESADIPGFFEIFWLTALFYNAALLFIKLTFLSQYFRIFHEVYFMRNLYRVAMILITAWNIGELFSAVFLCFPVSGFWDQTVESSCQNSKLGTYVNAVGNMITDVVIITLPLPALWKLHLTRAQKAAVFGVFGIGSITLVISLIRLTTIDLEDESDFTYDTWASSCFSIAELASGITCAAMATLSPLVNRVFTSFRPESPEAEEAARRARARDSKRPPTIGSGRSRKKSKQGLSKDEKEWAIDIYDLDLESPVPSLPTSPVPNLEKASSKPEVKPTTNSHHTRMTSTVSFNTANKQDSILLNLDTTLLDTNPTIAGIMVEREVEVIISRASAISK